MLNLLVTTPYQGSSLPHLYIRYLVGMLGSSNNDSSGLNTFTSHVHIISTKNTFVDGHDDRAGYVLFGCSVVPDLHAGLEIGPWFGGLADTVRSCYQHGHR
jgi:hypothetical protein